MTSSTPPTTTQGQNAASIGEGDAQSIQPAGTEPAPANRPNQNRPNQNRGPSGKGGPGRGGQDKGGLGKGGQNKGGQNKGGQGQNGPGNRGNGGQKHASDVAPIVVRPLPQKAKPKRRHKGLRLAFILMVIVPFIATAVYMTVFAKDQFASTTGFTIRSEETNSAAELMGGLSGLVGSSASSSNGDLLFAYIQSQQIVERIQQNHDILAHYSQNWGADPLFSIWPDATIEDLLWFWQRVVTASYDQASGLMDIQVLAGDPETARLIARAIVAESETMINALNEQARRDTMANAQRDLEDALQRVRQSREELASFRARTQIVDPQADIQGRMGVINNLQQQLAQALVDHDLLLQTSNPEDPRIRQALRRIDVIQERISAERTNFATRDATVNDTDYPRLIAQFESLMVNQEFAESTYTAALAAVDTARSNAQRQSLYLATFILPTLAQTAEYPNRMLITALVGIFLLFGWSILALIYYSLRDHG